MTADERLALIRVKIERAKQHLRNLEAVRDRFIETKPYLIESKHDPQTGYDIFSVTNVQTPPADIGIIAGDVIHNLRSALDHLAYQLVYVNGATHTKQTSFPIWDDATEYKAQRARKVKGMEQSAIDAIDATEPYQGGKGAGLWVLHYLDIADKHHALLTTLISLTGAHFEVPGFWQRGFKGIGGFSLPGFGKPLKDGDIIATREPNMGKAMELTLDITLTEPEVIKGRPLLVTLQLLIDLVDNLIVSFKPLLNEVAGGRNQTTDLPASR